MSRTHVWSAFCLAALTLVCCRAAVAQPTQAVLVAGFEDGLGPVTGEGQIVKQNASEGKSSYQLTYSGTGVKAMELADPAALARFKDYLLFKIDVYNPQSFPVRFGVQVNDATSKDFGTRFNDERGNVAPPGWSTYEINLPGLTRSNAKNYFMKERLDVSKLTLIRFTVGGTRPTWADGLKPFTIFFDNLRLENASLPKVEGMRAFDFGPSKADVYPGFEGCGEDKIWKDGADFGWVNPAAFDYVYMPDALGCDYGSGDEFRLKLPNGRYEVNFCMDPFGIWSSYPRFTWRKVLLSGKEVFSEKRTPQEFFDKHYFLHENDEDLPGQDLWNKFVLPRNVPRRFEADVTDGVLSVKIDSDTKWGKFIQYLVVYPEAKKDEGRKWMDALENERHEKFNKSMIVGVPSPTATAPAATAEDNARGFVPFVRHSELWAYLNSAPAADERGKPVAFTVARGERTGTQLVLYPLKEVGGLTLRVSDLAGPAGSKIASSAVTLRKVRNFLRRDHRTRIGNILPYLLQDFQTLDLKPGVTRAVWVTLTVPGDAAAGDYTGAITIAAGGAVALVPVKVTVLPFTLDKITDVTMSATGCRSTLPDWFPEMRQQWWTGSEAAIKDMADHGLNAVSGGAGAKLRSVKDGKADIDYTDIDRWIDLAKKYGLTMPGDGYQGCDVTNLPNDTRQDALAKNEQASREQFGVSYADLIRIVYADVEKHAKEQGWPVRNYYFLDEPRPEFRNVEACLELIKLRTQAAPGVRFSGYYSDGAGRDEYFKLMPVSISHVNENVMKLMKEGGKELWVYDGSRLRNAIGRWMYVAARAGVKGYLTNGYLYVNSDPYFDFTDDEAAWCVAWPGRNGVVDSVPWERVAEGINDYRYLLTLENLVKKAKASGKTQQAAQAQAVLDKALEPVDLYKSIRASLTPGEYDQLRKDISQQIIALNQALTGAAGK